MGGYVDVFRVELAQLVDGAVHHVDAGALQGRQDFEREGGFLRIFYQINYFHSVFLLGQNLPKLHTWAKIVKIHVT
jgi:hypothetical protein